MINFVTPYVSFSEALTYQWAQQLGTLLKPGNVVGLSGPLGAGKTLICKGICDQWGFKGSVTSPTYALIQEYPCLPKIIHMDFYRIEHQNEVYEMGLDYYLTKENLCLIEWPEKISDYPLNLTHKITLTDKNNDQRLIVLETF